MLAGGIFLPGVVKPAGMPQADVAEGGRLVDGKAHRPGGVGVTEVRVSVNTSGLKSIAHIGFLISMNFRSFCFLDL
jgi:hypothetical protein